MMSLVGDKLKGEKGVRMKFQKNGCSSNKKRIEARLRERLRSLDLFLTFLVYRELFFYNFSMWNFDNEYFESIDARR